MALTTGTRLGNYEVVAPLGAGGMGEVYRARDTRLGRSVAIKALPEAFARDPERLARFEREARILASMQHANIAAIYGIEDGDGTSYLALELVDGETLAQRLARGPLEVREALELCAQIASALDAAHEQGVVHRDLKPSNVMITAGGAVKVLDFGLAKPGPTTMDSSSNLSTSPTQALGATAAGMVLGTASYMSPEQARGKPVDRRADVWALGCILYECLTGQMAFSGETVSDVLARVLEREPDWNVLPRAVPSRLRDVLRRCLTKNPADRPRDIGDLRGELLAIAADLSSPGRRAETAGGPPSLAVLYFENLSQEPESEYFSAGITEDLLTDLSKVKGLRVASRSAVARYRGTTPDSARVASDLGVTAVLEGSVRRAGPRVRIAVRLVSADGFQLWGERYDRTFDDVFALQEEIASAIAGALKVALTPAETERMGQARPKDAQAYDLYLKGREQYNRFTPDSLHEAVRLFEQAIAVDASYALAWAGLGDTYGQLLQWTKEDPEELTRRGLEAARKAIALNPRLGEGHKAEGLVLGMSGDRKGSEAALRRAIEADPRHVPALGNLGVEWFRQANLAGAERMFRRALEVAPDDPHMSSWLSFLLAYTGRLDEAEALNVRGLTLSSDPFYVTIAAMWGASIQLLRNRAETLEAWLEKARASHAEPSNVAMLEAYVAVRSNRSDTARRLLAEWSGSTVLNFSGISFAAMTAFHLGDTALAVSLFQRRIIAEFTPVSLRLEPMMRPLLDLEPFGPRRCALSLIWPIEAPMPDSIMLGLFKEIRIESGRAMGSDILAPQ